MFIVKESSSKTTFGIIVHFVGANLEFDDLFVVSDDGSVERLVAILLWHSNVVFDATVHRVEKGMNNTKDEVASSGVLDDKTQSDNVVNAIDILVVFGEFLVERINRFNAAVTFVGDLLFLERLLNGGLSGLEFLIGFLETVGGKIFEFFIAARIDVAEASLFDFNADAAHLKTVGKRRKNFKRFAGNFLLFFGWQGAERAQIMEAISKLNNKYANVLAGGDEEFE